MAVPAFSDIAKAPNDVCSLTVTWGIYGPLMHNTCSSSTRTFITPQRVRTSQQSFKNSSSSWLNAANIDVKSKAPNGVTFNVKGKSAHEGSNSGQVSFYLFELEILSFDKGIADLLTV